MSRSMIGAIAQNLPRSIEIHFKHLTASAVSRDLKGRQMHNGIGLADERPERAGVTAIGLVKSERWAARKRTDVS